MASYDAYSVPSSGGGRRWKFGQCFGDKESTEELNDADLLTAVRFDDTGEFLATGDKGGRIVIFRRADNTSSNKRKRGRDTSGASSTSAGDSKDWYGGGGSSETYVPNADFRFYNEFQSHESEFDYLKSLEIEEKINQIAWCKRANDSLFLLSTNDKTIKLWKIHERRTKLVSNVNVETGRYGAVMPISSVHVPTISAGESSITATARRIYANAHAYHINSIAVNSDGQTFLSADDLRVNVWNLDNPKLAYNVVDIKPPSLEELTEVITAAEFHPEHCHMFMYASSRGTIKLADMRASALCDMHAKVFEEPDDALNKNYFSEIISSVSDIEFTRDGRYIISRDYLSIKVWDMAMESKPLRVIPAHEFLRPKLVELYDSDCIFDKFEVASAADGTTFMTGTYNNCLKIFDVNQSSETTIELSRARPRMPVVRRVLGGVGIGKDAVPPVPAGMSTDPFAPTSWMPPSDDVSMDGHRSHASLDAADAQADVPPDFEPFMPPIDISDVDFSKKVLHFSWHPHEDIIAVAGVNNLYIYHAL